MCNLMHYTSALAMESVILLDMVRRDMQFCQGVWMLYVGSNKTM
jgi:hypothetical protein